MEKNRPYNETDLHPQKEKQLKGEEFLPLEQAVAIQISDFFGPSVDASLLRETGVCLFERGSVRGKLKRNEDGSFVMEIEEGSGEAGALIERLAQSGVKISDVSVPGDTNIEILLKIVIKNAGERYF